MDAKEFEKRRREYMNNSNNSNKIQRTSFNHHSGSSWNVGEKELSGPPKENKVITKEKGVHPLKTNSHSSSSSVLGNEEVIIEGEEYDYLRRKFTSIPSNYPKEEEQIFYQPKKISKHQKNAHSSTSIPHLQFIPKSHHLLLSGGGDGTLKIWDLDLQLKRTYKGHSSAISGIDFETSSFTSMSRDNTVRHWDIERGISDWGLLFEEDGRGCPTSIKMISNSLLLCSTTKSLFKFDLRCHDTIKRPVLEYKGFSDGGSLLGIQLIGKDCIISSNQMGVYLHSLGEDMPQSIIHESFDSKGTSMVLGDDTFIFQSSPSRIQSITYKDGKILTGKVFSSPNFNSKYPTQMTSTPDGRWLFCGDSRGNMISWDFESGKYLQKIKVHDKGCLSVRWNPFKSSMVATSSIDGSIKIWD